MGYVPPDRDNKEIPCRGRHFARLALRQPNPRIMKADFVGEWAVTTVFVGRDDDGNWPPRFWWVGACHPHYPNVTCRFESEESALRWHKFVVCNLLHREAEVTDFPRQT
jgi:hypothetical protein